MEKKLIKGMLNEHTIKSTSGKSLSIDGAKVLPKKVKDYADSKLAKKYLSKDEMLEYYEWIQDDVGEILYNLIKQELQNKALSEMGLDEGVNTLDKKNSFIYTGLIPIKDIITNHDGLYDTNLGQISDLSYDAWHSDVSTNKDRYELLMGRRMLGLMDYNPFTINRAEIVEFQNQEIYQFNSHIFPEWRFHEVSDPTPPPFFFSLMEHLFPDEGARQFVYYWMRTAIFDRNQTVLLLSSNMGTGKGTLTDILEKLVGESNFQKQGDGFFQNRFSAELRNKRVVVFDEVSMGKKVKDQLKLYTNNTIAIEKKGQDVQTAIQNYASFVLINNYKHENHLVADDRRFSVPEITDTPLLEVFSESEVNEFHRELQYNPEVIANIGWWLKENGDLPEWDVHIPYKKGRFFQLVRESLREWEKFTIEKVESCSADHYTLEDLRIEFEEVTGSRKFPANSKMDGFLSQYKEMDGQIIAECVKVEGEWAVVPVSKYRASVAEFMDI